MCETLLANPLIEDYEIQDSSAGTPGPTRGERSASCASPAPATRSTRCSRPRASARPSSCGTRDRDLRGVDAVVVPGGFSYGDYLRVGRHRPLRAGHGVGRRFAARRRPGARDLQRLPGAVRGGAAARARCCPTRRCASSAGRWRSRSSTPTPPSRARARAGERCRSRSSTRPAAATPPEPRRRAPGRAALRARPEPQRLAATTSPACATPTGNVLGPDAPPRARGRPADGLGRRR